MYIIIQSQIDVIVIDTRRYTPIHEEVSYHLMPYLPAPTISKHLISMKSFRKHCPSCSYVAQCRSFSGGRSRPLRWRRILHWKPALRRFISLTTKARSWSLSIHVTTSHPISLRSILPLRQNPISMRFSTPLSQSSVISCFIKCPWTA
jgi:hypothetical protein